MKENWLAERLRKTVYDLLKVSVITWIAVFVYLIASGLLKELGHFTAFIGYTVGVYGLSKLPDKNTPAGGATA